MHCSAVGESPVQPSKWLRKAEEPQSNAYVAQCIVGGIKVAVKKRAMLLG